MTLAAYKAKRNFKRTAEPGAKVGAKHSTKLQFVIQKHDASRLHYDFRLELDGVLKSWAVPKGPSLDPTKKALAVQVEDHPVGYGDFEGIIPAGEYGGGTVLLWDRGTWEPLGDANEGFDKGKLHFKLDGEKLKGEWALVRMHGRAGDDGKNWLLMKVKDRYASDDNILDDQPLSVKTKRSLEEIGDDPERVWHSGKGKSANARKKSPVVVQKVSWPRDLSPQLAVLADAPPAGDDWVHEIKFDGYRLLAYVNNGNVELITRNGHNWTHKFPSIEKSLSKLKVKNAIFDGEAVVLDEEGRSDFQALQAILKEKEKAAPTYYVFDLLYAENEDLRRLPLIERKKKLEAIIKSQKLPANIGYSDHVRGDGKTVIGKACRMSLEGIISKRADAPYVGRRDATWIKSKCDQRQEFVIIGYTDPQGGRVGFGALLLGYYDDKKNLNYCGRVGTGFDDRLLGDMYKQLKSLEQKSPPTAEPPPARERRAAHWVTPKLVGEVRFTGWTRDGMLRHPAFLALRSDKPAAQIVREKPAKAEKVAAIAKKEVATKTVNPKSKAKSKHDAGGDVIEGVTLTHPDKLLYPKQGISKRDIAEHYVAAAEWMLPHVINRPLALVRCPAGQAAKCFFQRNYSDTLPDAVHPVNVSENRTRDDHVMVNDLSGIISLVQIGVLEIHTWNCSSDDVEHPDQLVFDLDPGDDVSWKQVIDGARQVRKALDELKLPAFLKTSGGKGLHLTVPIEPTITWESAKGFCETVAKSLVEQSDLFVANMRKDLRGGKIYIDYHRNGRGATAVAPYSTRARDGAPVSMPISWEELGKLKSANHFTVETAGRILEKRKADPWKDFERSRVDLQKLFHKSAA